MFRTRWHKVINDLSTNKLRTLLVILAISIGVFGISVVANSYSILVREMDKNYRMTTPASATLLTSPISDSKMQEISELPYLKAVEKRETLMGRVQVGETEWKDIMLFVIHDFENIRVETFLPEEGEQQPGTGEILFERKALSYTKASINQTVQVRIPNGEITSLQITGSVHAPGLAPAWMEGMAYGYITPATFRLLGGKEVNSELKLLSAEDEMNKEHNREIAYRLKAELIRQGIQVLRVEIPEPGQHPHFSQMATFLYLMEIFGLLALVLSSVLVANIITSIMEQQTRQIGIMKAIGAGSNQIAGLYIGMVVLFSMIAMLISIPLGIIAGRGYAELAGGILNFNIYSDKIPGYIYLLEVTVGLAVPILTSLRPIIKGSKITVREAISDYGIRQDRYSGVRTKPLPRIFRWLPRPFLLSIRNTFRKRFRLVFAILVMAVGGTGFIVAMNIYASMYNTVDKKMDSMYYDIRVKLDSPRPAKDIEAALLPMEGVEAVEAWGMVNASRVYNDRTTGNSFSIVAPKASTKLMDTPPLYEGRWLEPEDTNAIVFNQALLSKEADIRVGDEINLRINRIDTTWKVVGISKELIGLPSAYVNAEYLAGILGMEGFAAGAVVVAENSDEVSVTELVERIDQELPERGLPIISLVKLSDFRESLENHLLIIATFLIFMSALVVIVGGLGLAATLNINTLERTKEIGMLRAMGATSYTITGMIVTEGILIGILSWFISALLSWPLSRFVSYTFGMTFFETPLEFKSSVPGYVIWLMLVVLIAAIASYSPSKKAADMTVSKALSYE